MELRGRTLSVGSVYPGIRTAEETALSETNTALSDPVVTRTDSINRSKSPSCSYRAARADVEYVASDYNPASDSFRHGRPLSATIPRGSNNVPENDRQVNDNSGAHMSYDGARFRGSNNVPENNRHVNGNSSAHMSYDGARFNDSSTQTIETLQKQISSLQSALSGMMMQNNGNIVQNGETSEAHDNWSRSRTTHDNFPQRSQNNSNTSGLGNTAWSRPPRSETQAYNASQTRHSQNNFQNRSDEPKPRLPIFNGKSEWEPFWIQFQMMATRYMWNEEKQGEQLLFCLKDEALTFASHLTPDTRQDLSAFLRAMKRRFGDHVLAETHRLNLQNIKAQARESVQEYASRVNTAMTKAYPGLENTPLFADLTIDHLLNGLADQNLAYDVMTKKPSTLEEAIEMITWHDCCKGGTRKRTAVRQLTTDFQDDEQDSDNEDVDVRRVNSQRFVNEARLQQFGRDLKDTLVKEVSTAVSKDLKESIVQMETLLKKQNPGNGYKQNSDNGYKQNSDNGYKPRDRRPQRNQDGGDYMKNIECYSCHDHGHFSRNCPRKKALEEKMQNIVPENIQGNKKSEN
jgi:hypothetical protein